MTSARKPYLSDAPIQQEHTLIEVFNGLRPTIKPGAALIDSRLFRESGT
jgi:hypothetical protein